MGIEIKYIVLYLKGSLKYMFNVLVIPFSIHIAAISYALRDELQQGTTMNPQQLKTYQALQARGGAANALVASDGEYVMPRAVAQANACNAYNIHVHLGAMGATPSQPARCWSHSITRAPSVRA